MSPGVPGPGSVNEKATPSTSAATATASPGRPVNVIGMALRPVNVMGRGGDVVGAMATAGTGPGHGG